MIEFLNSLPMAGLLLAISIGYVLGNTSYRDLAVGPAGATLFVSLWLGWLGIRHVGFEGEGSGAEFSIGTFGFILYLYSIGFEAGPRFFASFRDRSGWRYALVAAVVNVAAIAGAFCAARLVGLGATRGAGAMAGALTSAPTFAASLELAANRSEMSVAFALAYPVGLVGIVLIIQIIPRFLSGNLFSLDEEESQRPGNVRYEKGSPELYRVLRVERPEVFGKTLRELRLGPVTGCVVTWVHRGDDEIFLATASTVLNEGDHLSAIGRVDELRELIDLVGNEVFDANLQKLLASPRRARVESNQVIGKSLAELNLAQRFNCLITRIERGSLWIEPSADVVLLQGDVLTLVGRRHHVRRVAKVIGKIRPQHQETDIALYTGGMFVGVLLGAIKFDLGGMALGPGFAGGLLFAGILLGWMSELGRVRANVPQSARQLVRDLGVMLFVGETGLIAGEDLAAGGTGQFAAIMLVSLITVLVAVSMGILVAFPILKLRAVDAWGAVAGGLTSSAALQTVRRVTDSNDAAVAYVTAYATASILATLAGRVIMRLL